MKRLTLSLALVLPLLVAWPAHAAPAGDGQPAAEKAAKAEAKADEARKAQKAEKAEKARKAQKAQKAQKAETAMETHKTDGASDGAIDFAASVAGAMDRSADPCADFYRYACGSWVDSTPLPSDQPRWTRSFSVIREDNREVVRELLEQAAANPGGGPDAARIGNYYRSCMDTAAIEETGLAPLESTFARIAGVEGGESLMRAAGGMHRLGADTLFGIGVFPDFKDPGTNIGFFVQGGLGMPERDYYVSDDPKKKELMAAYETHVARVLETLGAPAEEAAQRAAGVVAFETELAKASRPAPEMRLVEKLYHKIDRAGLQELTPNLPWDAFFAAAGHPNVTELNVATPEFFEALDAAVQAADAETLRAYLRWQLADNLAAYLPERFVQADFEFFGRELQGQQEIQPRWKRCVSMTENALGEAVGKLYVEKRFAGDSKQVALEMIGDIGGAFERALPQLAWMDDATRARALEKAHAVRDKIGYPDVWRDYSAMTIRPKGFLDNAIAANEFEFDRQARKVGKPVDRKEWGMTPQMVNAYYNPLLNEIAFPAGILQPPFFHRSFPAAMNYGAIGAVIGHELTHGFDDTGRKFDPTGEMREWWEPAVAERFEQQAQCVRDQYSRYEVEPGVAVQGDLTAGENIADIGGLKQSYAAYRSWVERHDEPDPPVPGLTDDQLFFVAYAQVWCSVNSQEYERMQVTTDSHSPARFRVAGAVSNNPAFAQAFACEPGEPMAPKERCTVW